MAGTRSRYTFAEARKTLADHGITIKSTDGEYRVAFRGRNADTESSAYYTSDLADAIGTGIDMAERDLLKYRVAGKTCPDMDMAVALAIEVFATSGVVVAIEAF